ncbi:outer membrane protein [Methylosinus sp. H3A]|uniref:outer membrane protein n=1 Tax=Methylosinus sp. H3A TaxID=2785786 RepID=UPI001FED7DAB|nr:outer membrane protein [Methylosinus sp. H3A]
MLRHVFSAATAMIALAGSAAATDLPSRKVSPAVLAESPLAWKGFYIGGHVGYAWADDKGASVSWPGVVAPVTFSPSGVIGGVHVGYNWQWSRWVAGLEGDADGASLGSTVEAPIPLLGSASVTARSPVQGSIRGRFGYAFDRILVYATGGAIWGGILNTYHLLPIGNSFSTTRTGWTAGGGVEYALNDDWSARIDYRYADFGEYYDGPVRFPLEFQYHHWTENQVKAGFSWKYSSPAPVAGVAKY